MNKLYYLFFLLLMPALWFSCQTNNNNEYVKLDFTDAEVLHNEINRIREDISTNAVYALWSSSLLYNEIHNEQTERLFYDCKESVLEQFDSAYENKSWNEALRLGQSLFQLESIVTTSNENSIDTSLEEKLNSIRNSYNSILDNTAESTQQDSNIPLYISGVVTIWVDLGVKVEEGLGFPNRSLGSGFFIDERGYIITNHHVIDELVDPEYEGYSRLYIKLSSDSETRIPAKVIGWDKSLDLALLKTEIAPPYVYTLGSSQNLNVGAQIFAIGSPLGLENTITSGIISAFDRQLLTTASVMQIDAAVNSGNSGGPLINVNGEVQGIVFAGVPTYQGLNFAIPVEYLKGILLRLYSGGEISHSWIGAYGRNIKRYPSDEESLGVEVLYVMPGSPAFKAGIEAGSIITSLNGAEVKSIEELQFALIHLIPESIISISTKDSIESESYTKTIYLDVRPEYPGLEIYKREPEYKMVYPLFGMELAPSSVGNRNQFTVQSIVRGSISDESGFSIHDPVEIRRTELSEDEDIVYIETFTKKRKSGYFEVNIGVGAVLDSPYLF